MITDSFLGIFTLAAQANEPIINNAATTITKHFFDLDDLKYIVVLLLSFGISQETSNRIFTVPPPLVVSSQLLFLALRGEHVKHFSAECSSIINQPLPEHENPAHGPDRRHQVEI
jgi:hypothetical protein